MDGVASDAPARRRILVIDDDPETARLLSSWFTGRPYDILTAGDGTSGIEAAARHNPDLVLLDLRMPDIDGIRVARRLKEAPATRAVPVILLTASRDVDDKVEAFTAGADDYVTKPFSFPEIDARILGMLHRRDALISLEATIRDLQAANSELEHLLTLDDKTGLANFREFRRKLREEWQRSERYGEPLTLVLLDLDDFKRINDTRGHPAGDRVLREFATLVAGGARSTDLAARYGGEEFALVLPHTELDTGCRVADRVRRAVEDFRFLADEGPARLTVSAGVATWPGSEGVVSVDDLVRAADLAMYRAKDLGKNRVEIAPRGDAGALSLARSSASARRASPHVSSAADDLA